MAKWTPELEAELLATLAMISSIQAARDGLADIQVEREANLPQGWLKKTRAGNNRSPAGMESRSRAVRWVAANRVNAPARSSKPSAEPSSVPVPAQVVVKEGGASGAKTWTDLAGEIRGVGTSPKRLRQAMQSLAILSIEHPEFDPKRSDFALSTLKAMKEPIKLEKIEAAQEKMGDLRVMTLDQEEQYLAWLATKASNPLAPGERAQAPKTA